MTLETLNIYHFTYYIIIPQTLNTQTVQRESFGEIFTELLPLAPGGFRRMADSERKKPRVSRGHFCAALNCTNSQYKQHCRGKSFYRFPKDKQS